MPIEFCKYLLIGGTNTLFTGVVYFLLLKVHCPYLIALIISWFLGILLTYTFNFMWVFKPEQSFSFQKRFWRYLTSYTVSLTFNLVSLKYCVDHYSLDPFYAQLLIMPFVIIFNYLAAKFWSLKPHSAPAKSIDLASKQR